jgi:hypothetical protein
VEQNGQPIGRLMVLGKGLHLAGRHCVAGGTSRARRGQRPGS